VGTKACGGVIPLQYSDGAIDSELDVLRFGLMTFDQDPDPSTGMTGGGTVASPNAFTGMWSYFPSWNTGGTLSCPASPAPFSYCGMPANCSSPTLMAVGARNPAAPPWEGRMMPFPSATDIPSQETQNLNVQQVLLASRPFGATPLAGMFAGAQYYLQTDSTGPQQSDTFVKQGCRPENIILLTDGAPNLDMQPSCRASGAPNGVCPFQLPETTAATLATAPLPVTTYVIGFAVSSFNDQGTTIYCSNLVNNGTLAAACTNPTALYAPCCELQRIAVAGGTSRAYFADSPADLQKALASILGQIAKNTTTRTVPAYSSVITNASVNPNSPTTNASLFLASFFPSPGLPWSGNVQRQRYVCAAGMGSTFVVNAPQPDSTVGDDFAANLNSNSPARTFIMFQPDVGGSGVDATATIRPYVAAGVGDGLGKYSASTVTGTATSVLSKITPAALALTPTQCTYNPVGSAVLKGAVSKTLTSGGCPLCLCRDMLLDFTFGQPFSSNPGDFPFVTRVGNAFGDVFHATPAVVGPPGSLLRDDSYIGFASVTSGFGSRKQIVYVATNDGLLHAFWADETMLENNELWAMMPPAVMPNLATSYPASHNLLLDGSPVVKDVVWDRPAAKQGDPTTWHTMLVAGFGPTQRGYYAVDVTNPNPSGMAAGPAVPTDPPPTGPVFRWQLTNMPGTNAPLFGKHAATPAITSVFVDPGDGKGAREIGVAILPGGQDSPPTSSAASGPSCARAPKPAGNAAPFTGYAARAAVRCWGPPQTWTDPVVGRSLSIVRLDTGEILRVFMRATDSTGPYPGDTLFAKGRITDTPLDSPMTGVPIVYPTDVGTDATRVFVGDADGTMWRFDLSNSDPSKWVGELYLDLYNHDATATPPLWSDGQPVQLAPVISLDPAGNVVLNVATGTQETFDSTGFYYVYSISEMVDSVHAPAKLRAQVNWWLDPATVTTSAGERVSGPMTVFDGTLYFSTYAAAAAGTQACKSGHGRIWGLDFLQPVDSTNRKLGGIARLVPPPAGHNQYIQPHDPVTGDPSLIGVVIPGVSI
ncbi:MAG: PilC/PilY family type IV pilus protein, partial [Myxococcota bacterium]|nr:PilC/PilY family type IV pilus protein [Myxococcota bacterium]